jgi:hypothetical protein
MAPMAIAMAARTAAAVMAVVVTLATPPWPPLDPQQGHFSMTDVCQPVAGAHRHVPRPGTYGTAAPAGLPSHTRPLHTPGIHAWATTTTTIPACRTCSFSRLDILEWHGLGPAIAHKLLQHHDAPTTSYLGSGLGSRFWRLAPHRSFSW